MVKISILSTQEPQALLIVSLWLSGLSAAKPCAISVPVRPAWLGYDGNWSPVSIRVGTPPQWVEVFVSTMSQETWVIGPGGCDGTSKCTTERGGIFSSNESSSWDEVGFSELGLDPQLEFDGFGQYGFDSVALNDEISVPSQTIGIINTTEYWLGYLGLGVKPTNFTNVDKPTFLSSMVENQSLIPSHSYGYTAGAFYRLKGTPGSLTLGGYDVNRFDSHNISFDLSPDQDPVVSVNQISVAASPLSTSKTKPEWPGGTQILLKAADANLFTIDSSTPYLWLPETVCTSFERALGLVYDETVALYTFSSNSSQRSTLLGWNLTFTFVLADLPGSAKTIALSLPYAAFDLQLSYPFPGLNVTAENSTTSRYFPLRRAANESQYTIGRAFLQETYLVVDYERNNFSVYQSAFTPDAISNTQLVDITRPGNSTFSGPQSVDAPGLSRGRIVGISIGASAALATFLTLSYCCLYRRRIQHHQATRLQKKSYSKRLKYITKFLRLVTGHEVNLEAIEIDGTTEHPKEAPADREIVELPTIFVKELQGSDTSSLRYNNAWVDSFAKAIPPMDHNSGRPIELESPVNTWNSSTTTSHKGPKHALPPYSPGQVGTVFAEHSSISRREEAFTGQSSRTPSSTDLSPETPRLDVKRGGLSLSGLR